MRVLRWFGRLGLDILLTPWDAVTTVGGFVQDVMRATRASEPQEWRRLATPARLRVITDVTKDGRRQWHTVHFRREGVGFYGYAGWCAEQPNMHLVRLRDERGGLLGEWSKEPA